MSKKPIWYLPGPFFRYVEDVKELAAKAGVRIVDANVTASRDGAAPEKDLPSVSLKPEYGGAPAEAKAAEKMTVDELKAALAEKSVTIPEGVTKKADLLALLQAAALA